jgi:hypothetical protein
MTTSFWSNLDNSILNPATKPNENMNEQQSQNLIANIWFYYPTSQQDVLILALAILEKLITGTAPGLFFNFVM